LQNEGLAPYIRSFFFGSIVEQAPLYSLVDSFRHASFLYLLLAVLMEMVPLAFFFPFERCFIRVWSDAQEWHPFSGLPPFAFVRTESDFSPFPRT